MSKPQMTVLENGLTVVTQHLPSRQVYANLKVGVGSRHETEQESGMSHFLEHMLASDTERMTAEETAAALQMMRGISNASTTQEYTDFEYHLHKDHTEDAIQMLADGVLRPTITPERLESERGSIQQEWLSYSGDTTQHIYQTGLQLAFPGSGLDKPIDGTPEFIANCSREDLLDFMQRHYSGDRMVLSVVGDVDHQQICDMAAKHFDGLPPHTPAPTVKPAEYRGGMRIDYMKGSDETAFTLAFNSSGADKPQDNVIDTVVAGMIAGSFASRLTRELRSDTGLVYSVSAYNEPFRDNGLFSISTACDSRNAEEVMTRTCNTLRKFPATATQEEMEQAKQELIGELERSMTSAPAISGMLSNAVLEDGKATSMEDVIDAIENVTLEQVKSRSEAIFTSAPSISGAGNRRHRLPDYEDITSLLGKTRKLDASGLAVSGNLPSPDRGLLRGILTGKPAKSRDMER